MRRYVISVETIAHTRSKLYIAGIVEEGTVQIEDHLLFLGRSDLANEERAAFYTNVNLRVERINVYRCDMNSVSAGWTAGFELSGDLDLRIGPFDQLIGESENEEVISALLSRNTDMPLHI